MSLGHHTFKGLFKMTIHMKIVTMKKISMNFLLVREISDPHSPLLIPSKLCAVSSGSGPG
jgi:hypothetical protein